tara:strand:+ start:2255 stop:2374 length:120 start_codon:yes stop_codon:yes gene_type:complete
MNRIVLLGTGGGPKIWAEGVSKTFSVNIIVGEDLLEIEL